MFRFRGEEDYLNNGLYFDVVKLVNTEFEMSRFEKELFEVHDLIPNKHPTIADKDNKQSKGSVGHMFNKLMAYAIHETDLDLRVLKHLIIYDVDFTYIEHNPEEFKMVKHSGARYTCSRESVGLVLDYIILTGDIANKILLEAFRTDVCTTPVLGKLKILFEMGIYNSIISWYIDRRFYHRMKLENKLKLKYYKRIKEILEPV